jgi:hypothetical protein
MEGAKSFAGLDPGETDARHAIHLRRENEAVPVDAGHLLQAVGHAKPQSGERAGSQVLLFPTPRATYDVQIVGVNLLERLV